MSIMDFLEDKKKKEKRNAQLKMEPALFDEVSEALKEDGRSFQEILHAGVMSYLSERKKKARKK